MAYASISDLTARFGEVELMQLTDTAQTGEVDSVRLALELDSASGQMDVYIGARYPLPLTGLTDGQANDLTRICCDIARYRLWNDSSSEEVRLRYQDAIRVLEMIAKGALPLTTNGVDASEAVGPHIAARTRAFTDSVWEAFKAL